MNYTNNIDLWIVLRQATITQTCMTSQFTSSKVTKVETHTNIRILFSY